VRGLYLAVVIFAFALAAQQYLYDRPILGGEFTDSVRRSPSPGARSTRIWAGAAPNSRCGAGDHDRRTLITGRVAHPPQLRWCRLS